jgi:hypothetical protein
LKALVGFALTVGDVILVKAVLDTFHAPHHRAPHGGALAAYAVAALLSLALWAWVLRSSKPRPAQRAGGYPYGGGRR